MYMSMYAHTFIQRQNQVEQYIKISTTILPAMIIRLGGGVVNASPC